MKMSAAAGKQLIGSYMVLIRIASLPSGIDFSRCLILSSFVLRLPDVSVRTVWTCWFAQEPLTR